MINLILATRYLAGRKLRTALTTLAIVFGVLLIFGMNSMLPAFTAAFQSNILAVADLVDATVSLEFRRCVRRGRGRPGGGGGWRAERVGAD